MSLLKRLFGKKDDVNVRKDIHCPRCKGRLTTKEGKLECLDCDFPRSSK